MFWRKAVEVRGASRGLSRFTALGRRKVDEGAVGRGHRRSFRRTVLECKFLFWGLAAAGGFQLLSQRINCLLSRIKSEWLGPVQELFPST